MNDKFKLLPNSLIIKVEFKMILIWLRSKNMIRNQVIDRNLELSNSLTVSFGSFGADRLVDNLISVYFYWNGTLEAFCRATFLPHSSSELHWGDF